MKRRQKPEISSENQAAISKLADLLGQANEILEKIYEAEDESYTKALNLIHHRVPDTFLLGQLAMDANDSEMRSPK